MLPLIAALRARNVGTSRKGSSLPSHPWSLTAAALRAVQNPYPQAERLLYSFGTTEDLDLWTLFSDKEYGGKSEAELTMAASEPVRADTPWTLHIAHLFSYERSSMLRQYISTLNAATEPCHLSWAYILGHRGV